MFEIERVRDRKRKIGYSLHKGTEILVRVRERFEIKGVRDRESTVSKFLYDIVNYMCIRLSDIVSIAQRKDETFCVNI